MATVSILIPARRADYLGRALVSAQRQTFEDIEILVGDDTPDAVLEPIVNSFDDPRIRYFHHGFGHARRNAQALWARASGRYVKWLGDEDLLMPTSVALLVDALESHPEAALAFHGRVFIDENDAVIHKPHPLLSIGAHEPIGRDVLVNEMVRRMHNFVGEPSNVMVDRTRATEDDLFTYRSHPLDYLSDVGMYLNLAEKGPIVAVGGYWSMLRRYAAQTLPEDVPNYSAGLYEWELFVRGEAAAGQLSGIGVADAVASLKQQYAPHTGRFPEIARLLANLDEMTTRAPQELLDSERFKADLAEARAAVAMRVARQAPAARAPAPAPVSAPASAAPAAHLCAVCEQGVDAWSTQAGGADRTFLDALGAVDGLSASQVCPKCGSNGHERHLWLYAAFSRLLEQAGAMRILHIAPEPRIESRIRRLTPLDYVAVDPFAGTIDLEALGFGEARFDLVICNHVLERVARPDAVLAELHRCLKPGGHLIAQTSYAPALRQTLEADAALAPQFAVRHFGRADRVRLFGADVPELFHRAGFAGEPLPHAAMLGELDAVALGCDAREPFFHFVKDAVPAPHTRTAAPRVARRAPKPIRLVCATRKTQQDFMRETALGRSLSVHRYVEPPELLVFDNNTTGLPTLYNAAIEQAASSPAVLVFVHDDVSINDFFWMERIHEALEQFDVVGLAGNVRRVPRQPSWAFPTEALKWDDAANLSGSVGHGIGFPCDSVARFGPSGLECKLLDGLMLVADSERLIERGVRFDERFAFHFYDLDFCRQAELKGLRMGTWPISVVHESGGSFDSPAWAAGYESYLSKYGE